MSKLHAWVITKAQYNNLLPVMRRNLLARCFTDCDQYTFVGTFEEYTDAMRRCAYL